jgi:hypothetical protein
MTYHDDETEWNLVNCAVPLTGLKPRSCPEVPRIHLKLVPLNRNHNCTQFVLRVWTSGPIDSRATTPGTVCCLSADVMRITITCHRNQPHYPHGRPGWHSFPANVRSYFERIGNPVAARPHRVLPDDA